MRSITIGQYIPTDSVIHRLDPRTKIMATLMYIVLLFLIRNFSGYAMVLGYLALITILAKLKFSYLYKGLRGVFFLILFTTALNLFLTRGQGEPLFQLGFVRIYREGLNLALYMTLRLIFLVLGTSLLTLTTSPIELTDGIEKLLSPFKRFGMPAHELAMMMSIALRFIPTLMDETDKIMKAQMARGADFESKNLVKKARSLIPILVPLFISSFRRAEDLAMAMEARCYRGGEGRTRMKELMYTHHDFIAYAVFAVLVGGIILIGMPRFGLP